MDSYEKFYDGLPNSINIFVEQTFNWCYLEVKCCIFVYVPPLVFGSSEYYPVHRGLDLVRQQAITWANVDTDLCRHMASLGHNRMAWQWAETLVDIRGTLVDIRGTTK